MRRHALIFTSMWAALGLALASPAIGAGKKSIWGPAELPAGNSACPAALKCSAFPTYAALGVDTYQVQLHWDAVAPAAPVDPRNPADPAYKWPTSLDLVLQQAAASGIEVAILVQRSPAWANGGRPPIWAPDSAGAFGDFLFAASRRYPTVRKWMIWGEASRNDSFLPMAKGRREGPRRYAALLKAAYKALKLANRANVVIGGMTMNAGTITPPVFIRYLGKKGKLPPMDLWGHNPFDRRPPRLKKKPIGPFRGLNDVDTLWMEIKKAYRGQKRRPKGLFLSEWFVPTDRPAPVFADNFFVSREEQARRITAAYRMIARLKYVKSLGWFTLQDETSPTGNAWGLMEYGGARKPGFFAYAAAP
jgi:hypothetical protein